MNMFQLLEKTANEFPNNIFLVREGVTFADFVQQVRARATSLYRIGVKQGDVVGVLSHNIPDLPLTIFAIWYLGGCVLLLDTNLTQFEYNNMTCATNCKLVCAEKSFFYETDNFQFYDIRTTDSGIDINLEAVPVESLDNATLSFTSGSTGCPKIVPLSHFNLIECAHSLTDMAQWFKAGDVIYGFLPMYHVFGLSTQILAPVQYGAGVLLQASINPKELLKDFKQYNPHVIPAVPRVFEVIRNKIVDTLRTQKKYNFVRFILSNQTVLKRIGFGWLVNKIQIPIKSVFGDRISLLIAGGAATKPEVETFYESLGITFIQGYGLTETVGPICISKPVKCRLPFAFGRPTSNNDCEIRDKNSDGVGVLWLRGHQVFNGYLNNPEVNAEVFDERGFFNTGDMVSMDKNGELHFAGRKKQVIVLDSGKNVYPDELEALFVSIPGVKNVAVFEHVVKGKTVAYAVFSVSHDMTLDKLADAVIMQNKKIASYKWVTHFAMTTDDLPTTSTQKIKHHLVKQNLIDGVYTVKKE